MKSKEKIKANLFAAKMVEVGYRPIKDLRLGLGYTFTEYDDGSQAHNDQDYLSRGPYFKITLSPSF